MAELPVVTLYGKPGCHLCDEARRVVQSVRSERPFELREVDVSLDPGLHRDYGERIPVVSVNGDEAFQFHVEAEALRALLGAGERPEGRRPSSRVEP